ncbi:TPA: AraC family transcriptional regulator [Enterobacter asburiae]|jgi:AraC-like DNA-binding protein
MNVKAWLSQQTNMATSIFHSGRYCDTWKASTFETGLPSFHVVLDGFCWLNFSDSNKRIRLEEGDIVFFFFNLPFYLTSEASTNVNITPKKKMYSIKEKKEGDTALLCGFLHPKGIEAEILFTLLPEYIIINKEIQASEKITQLISMLKLETNTACELALTRITDLLLIYVVEQLIDEYLVDVNLLKLSQHKGFARLLIEIMHNPAQEWSLEIMADKMNMSRSTFIRKLDYVCGLSSNSLITTLRINIAVNLLRRGYNADDVAFKIGYKSTVGFYKAFKKITLRSPSNFWREM